MIKISIAIAIVHKSNFHLVTQEQTWLITVMMNDSGLFTQTFVKLAVDSSHLSLIWTQGQLLDIPLIYDLMSYGNIDLGQHWLR